MSFSIAIENLDNSDFIKTEGALLLIKKYP